MWTFEIFGLSFFYIFYFFFITAFIGWIYESCFVSIKNHKITNRGFLNGPVIPIYGAGGTAIMLATTPFKDDLVLVFFAGMFVASLLEYVTSYLMEKLFHAKWWDYSDWKPNLNGRICLWASLFWGVLSVSMQLFIKPAIDKLIAKIPEFEGIIAAYIIFTIFIADIVYTVICTVQFDKKIAAIRSSYEGFKTELKGSYEGLKENYEGFKVELKDRYIESANKFSFVEKRLVNAFPDLKFTNVDDELKEWINERIDKKIEKRNNER